MVLNTDFGKQRTYCYTLFLILLKLFVVNVKTMLRGWVLKDVPYQLPNYINNRKFVSVCWCYKY